VGNSRWNKSEDEGEHEAKVDSTIHMNKVNNRPKERRIVVGLE